jgi:hypothetical protein
VPVRPPRRGAFLIRLELGLAAFAPALALLAVRARSSELVWLFVIPAVAGLIVFVYGAAAVARGNPEPFAFDVIEDRSTEVIGHVTAYVLPLLVPPSASTEQIVITAVVLAFIIHIHVATGRVHVNPLLYLLGYRVYSASTRGPWYYLVARSDVSEWARAQPCIQVGAGLLVERQGHAA